MLVVRTLSNVYGSRWIYLYIKMLDSKPMLILMVEASQVLEVACLPVEIRRNIFRIWSRDKSRLLEKLVNLASSFQRREIDRIGYPAPFCMVDVSYKKFE